MNVRITRRNTLTASTLLFALVLPFLAATPANAEHTWSRDVTACSGANDRNSFFGRTTQIGHTSFDYSCAPLGKRSAYREGFRQGEFDGFRQGYDDAMSCREFCPTVKQCFRPRARFFERGYRDAYADAYLCGWKQAKRDLNRRRR